MKRIEIGKKDGMCVCVLVPFILDAYTFRCTWGRSPGSHRRAVTQDIFFFPSTFSFCNAWLSLCRERRSSVAIFRRFLNRIFVFTHGIVAFQFYSYAYCEGKIVWLFTENRTHDLIVRGFYTLDNITLSESVSLTVLNISSMKMDKAVETALIIKSTLFDNFLCRPV